MQWVGLQCVIAVFHVHTHFLKAGFQVALTADILFFIVTVLMPVKALRIAWISQTIGQIFVCSSKSCNLAYKLGYIFL